MIRRCKSLVGLLTGAGICRLFPGYKLRLLESWVSPDRLNRFDRALFPLVMRAWAEFEYVPIRDPDERERVKGSLMGGGNGASWADQYQRDPLRFDEAHPLLPALDTRMKQQKGSTLVLQVGSSSGKEIAWLAGRHPQHEYIGIDPYPDVIAFSRRNHSLPHLSFLAASAKDIPGLVQGRNQTVILYSSGSLQYVQPEHLGRLFRELAGTGRIELWLLEPARESDMSSPLEISGSRWWGNFSYTHNYRYYAETAGWKTGICEIIRPYSHDPVRKSTVHYFYMASTEKKDS
jgi:hypothetical protein